MITLSSSIKDMSNDHELQTPSTHMVWDLPIRVLHWALVCAVLGAWVTRQLEGDWFYLHTYCGYAVLLIVATRLVWGALGTRHARFAFFLPRPTGLRNYLRALAAGSVVRSVGHNPLGALMVLVLLGLLLAQALTGLFANDDFSELGPLTGYVSSNLSDQLTGLHHRFFQVIEFAVLVHVAAVFYYLIFKCQNLIKPMFTGRKPIREVPPGEAIKDSRVWLALSIFSFLVFLLWWVVRTAPPSYMFDY